MIRALLGVAALLLVLVLAMSLLLNLSPAALPQAIDVATGLGAKLACSGRFVSGQDPGTISGDLASYSPAFGLVRLEFDEARGRARASLFGASDSATFRPGLGCTRDLSGSEKLNGVNALPLPPGAGEWPSGERVNSIGHDDQARLETLLAADTAGGYQTRALALVRGGRLVAEAYAPGYGPNTPLLGWSMGKSVIALLLGLAERDGLLSPAEQSLFPDWAQDGRAAISIENLLQMNSGLAFEERYAPGSDATYMLSQAPSAAAVALQKPLRHPPGSHFYYSSGTTNLLALLFQQRVGGTTQDALDYLQRELLAPLGMAHTVLEPDPSGVFVGSSFIYGSARDWARLGLLLLRDGVIEGQRLLPKGWVARATAPNGSDESRYGYQLWLNGGGDSLRWPELPPDAYAMQGNREQVVMMVPSEDTVIVRLGWSASGYPRSEKFSRLLTPR